MHAFEAFRKSGVFLASGLKKCDLCHCLLCAKVLSFSQIGRVHKRRYRRLFHVQQDFESIRFNQLKHLPVTKQALRVGILGYSSVLIGLCPRSSEDVDISAAPFVSSVTRMVDSFLFPMAIIFSEISLGLLN